jgi:hypothetical protein
MVPVSVPSVAIAAAAGAADGSPALAWPGPESDVRSIAGPGLGAGLAVTVRLDRVRILPLRTATARRIHWVVVAALPQARAFGCGSRAGDLRSGATLLRTCAGSAAAALGRHRDLG